MEEYVVVVFPLITADVFPVGGYFYVFMDITQSGRTAYFLAVDVEMVDIIHRSEIIYQPGADGGSRNIR